MPWSRRRFGPDPAPGPDRSLRALVRINDPETQLGAADLAMLVELTDDPGHGLIGVMVPKAASVTALAAVIKAVAGGAAGRPAGAGATGRAAGAGQRVGQPTGRRSSR